MNRVIARLLESFTPEPWEAPVIERMRGLVSSSASVRRDAFRPGHFTASGIVVSPDGGSVLLVAHRRLGRWLQPGGHLEDGDRTPRQAASREVAEETGVVDLSPVGPALLGVDNHPIPARDPEPAHRHLDLRFGFVAPVRPPVPADEVDAAGWVPIDALERFGLDASARRHVRRLVAAVSENRAGGGGERTSTR